MGIASSIISLASECVLLAAALFCKAWKQTSSSFAIYALLEHRTTEQTH